MKQVCLFTGKPGTGKTNPIKRAVVVMGGKVGGFCTEEIRNGGAMMGFRLVTLDGESAILAHVNIHSPYRVSKYGVDIVNLDQVGVSALYKAAEECDLIVIDEIRNMELFSANFKESVSQIIDSQKKVIGTILFNSHLWADAIKLKTQVNSITVTLAAYHQVLAGLLQWLKATDRSVD